MSSPTLVPLQLSYELDAAQAQERMRAYRAGEMIGRPCVSTQTATGYCSEKTCQYYQECQDWKYGEME